MQPLGGNSSTLFMNASMLPVGKKFEIMVKVTTAHGKSSEATQIIRIVAGKVSTTIV